MSKDRTSVAMDGMSLILATVESRLFMMQETALTLPLRLSKFQVVTTVAAGLPESRGRSMRLPPRTTKRHSTISSRKMARVSSRPKVKAPR